MRKFCISFVQVLYKHNLQKIAIKPCIIGLSFMEDVPDDRSDLTGMAKIVNHRKVNNKLDLESIERELMSTGGLKRIPVKAPDQELSDILKGIRTEPLNPISAAPKISHVIRTEKSGGSGGSGGSALSKLQQFVGKTNPAIPFGMDEFEEHGEPEEFEEPGESGESGDFKDFKNFGTYETDDSEDTFEPDEPAMPPMPTMPVIQAMPTIQAMPAMPAIPAPPRPVYSVPPRMAAPAPVYYPTQVHRQPPASVAQEALQAYAGDQERQDALDEQERMEDLKEKMISDIEDLREELSSENIKIDRIPEVTMDSPYQDVEKTYKQIKRKYDRSRCEDLGQNVLMASARMIEMMFDGKRSYFGYRPDMTGWHRTVRSKMRRMKYEQSVIVSNALEYYNVGPVQRMGLELIPSAFLYSLTRREQHGNDNYTPDGPARGAAPNLEDDRSAALDDLREFDA